MKIKKNYSKAPAVKLMLLQISKRRKVKKMLLGAPTVKFVFLHILKIQLMRKSFWGAHSGTHYLYNFEKVYFPIQNFEKKTF